MAPLMRALPDLVAQIVRGRMLILSKLPRSLKTVGVCVTQDGISSGLYQDALASAGVRVEGEVSRRRGNKLKPSVYCTCLGAHAIVGGRSWKGEPWPGLGISQKPSHHTCRWRMLHYPNTTTFDDGRSAPQPISAEIFSPVPVPQSRLS
jgi:hypothetical protein